MTSFWLDVFELAWIHYISDSYILLQTVHAVYSTVHLTVLQEFLM